MSAGEELSVPRDLLIAALARSPVLSQCSRQDLARLVPFLRERTLQPGEALFSAGQPAVDMWLVLRGTLRLKRADDSPHDVSDGLVGEEAALGIACYMADVVALGQATVVALGKDMTPAILRGRSARAQEFGRSLIHLFAPTPFIGRPADVEQERLTPALAAWKSAGWIGAIVMPLVLLQLFAGTSLRWEQQQLAAVLASTAMLWIFGAVRPYVAGLLVILVCVTLGIVPTTVVLSGFASNGFFLALSMFSLAAVLIESAAINRAFLLLMKYSPRSAVWHDLAAMFAGIVLTPIVTLARDRARVLTPLAVDAAQTSGYEPGSRARTRLLLSTFMGLALFSPMFLTGSAINLMLYGSLPEQIQAGMPGTRWLLSSLAAALVMLGAFLAVYLVVFWRGAAPRSARHTIDAQLALLGPMRVTEWVAVGGVLLFVGAVATVSAHKIDHRLLALAVVCGYLVLGTLGKDQLNLHIDWSSLILLGTVIGIVATMLHVGLHTAIGTELTWLTDLMTHRPRVFVALLAAGVVLGGFFIPTAGALIGLIAIPLAMFNGMNPWIVVFVILLMNDVWFLPYQSEAYRTFREIARSSGPFDEKLALRFNAAMAVARIVALAAAVPYWEGMRVL